jgi:hypothetical protein
VVLFFPFSNGDYLTCVQRNIKWKFPHCIIVMIWDRLGIWSSVYLWRKGWLHSLWYISVQEICRFTNEYIELIYEFYRFNGKFVKEMYKRM